MKHKQFNWFEKLTSCICVGLMTLVTLLPALPARALDVQALPTETRAASDYTHAARVTWDDLNAADASTVTLQLIPIPTNGYIDRIGFYVEELFTNSTIANTNLTLTIGIGGNTNLFYGTNYIDGGTPRLLSGASHQFYQTNLLIPFRATTSTNYLTVTVSDGAAQSVVDNYNTGRLRIYWRLLDLSKVRF